MKHVYILSALLLSASSPFAQIGVGTSSPHATARFQVDAASSGNRKGFLGPQVALTSTTANSPFTVTPATGLLVYNTATAGSGGTEVTPGYYSYTGSGWERLAATPTTFVGGTAGGFPIGSTEYIYGAPLPVWSPIGNISLPPGRWEIIAEYTCVPGGTLFWGTDPLTNWENTYWISTSETRSAFASAQYPLNVTGLSVGAPTSDAMFNGAAISLQKVLTVEAGVHYFPKQSMRFYINNPGATDKTYYLHFAESIINKALPTGSGPFFEYQANSGENRFYAVKIQ